MRVYEVLRKNDETIFDAEESIEEEGKFNFKTAVDVEESRQANDFEVTNVEEANSSSNEDSLVVWIDAIHAMTTANHTTYKPHELRGSASEKTGQYSWTYPYDKPVLTHHQSRRGEPIGRVIKAQYKRESEAGAQTIRLKVKVSDETAKQKIKDGRYQTVSIGGTAGKAECSICGTNLAEEFCSHWPGREYDGEVATVILRDIVFKEVSFVNVPADEYAGIIDIEDEDSAQGNQENIDQLKTRLKESASSASSQVQSNQGGSKMDLEEKVAVKEERIEVLETKLENKNDEISTLEDENDTLEEKVDTLETKVENKDSKIKELTDKNQELKSKHLEHLASKVVDKKISLDRLPEENRESKVEEHIKRGSDYLEYALEDLKEEEEYLNGSTEDDESYDPQEMNEGVEDPTLNDNKEKKVKDAEEDESDSKQSDEEREEKIKSIC